MARWARIFSSAVLIDGEEAVVEGDRDGEEGEEESYPTINSTSVRMPLSKRSRN